MEKEVSHAEIYSRLILVEQKVDRIDKNTEGVVAAFQAAIGRVLLRLSGHGLRVVAKSCLDSLNGGRLRLLCF